MMREVKSGGRKIVRFLAYGERTLYVLCDDGTLWLDVGRGWEEIQAPPRDDVPPPTIRPYTFGKTGG